METIEEFSFNATNAISATNATNAIVIASPLLSFPRSPERSRGAQAGNQTCLRELRRTAQRRSEVLRSRTGMKVFNGEGGQS